MAKQKLGERAQSVNERAQSLTEAMAPVQAEYQAALANQARLNPALRLLEMFMSATTPGQGPKLTFKGFSDDKYYYGYAFDPTTGQVRQVLKQPIQKTTDTGSGDKVPASKYKVIDDLLSQTFLPVYKYVLRNKYKNESEVAARMQALQDSFGNLNTRRLYAALPPEVRKLWSSLYKTFEARIREGKPIGDLFNQFGTIYELQDPNQAVSTLQPGEMAITPLGLVIRVNNTGDVSKDFRLFKLGVDNATKKK